MQVNLSWIFLGLIFVPAALQSPELTENIKYADSVRQETKALQRESNKSELLAQQSKADSEIALSRVSSGCVPVVSSGTDNPTYLTENMPVQLRDGENLPLGDNSLVCTELGDTGEVWDGKVHQVKRIAPEHKVDYQSIFSTL